MGKKINFHVDGCSDGKTNVGLDFYTTQFIYSESTPPLPPSEPTIIEEILKSIKLINVELGKINMKIDDMDKRIANIELVQKAQGEEIKEIKENQKSQGEKLDRLENKLDTVIILNNLKTE
jgi:peptidoglycan hydrolase CwlO-like protein